MRYINVQQHATSCGPTAVMNALKWLGFRVNYREYIDYFKNLGYEPGAGTTKKSIKTMLEFYEIKHSYKFRPTISDIEDILDSGKSVILSYSWWEDGQEGTHWVFVDSHSKKYLRSKNDGDLKGRKKKQFSEWFKRSLATNDIRPRIFIIERD